MVSETSPPGEADRSIESEEQKSTECRYCDRDFDSYAARRKHEGLTHTQPYHKESVLREHYWDEGMSMAEIADEFDISVGTVRTWMEKNDIETRGVHDHQKRVGVNCALDHRGYMKWSTYVGDNNKHVQVHRLLAVAEFGFDAVCGKVVHHKNNLSWDNRPENIELMTVSEHAKEHYDDDHPLNN